MVTQQNARPVTALLGRKLGMTQLWDEAGRLVPVTVVKVGTNVVTQVRSAEADGYAAVQLAFGQIDPRKVTQPLKGHFEKAGVTPRRNVAEIRTPNAVAGPMLRVTSAATSHFFAEAKPLGIRDA